MEHQAGCTCADCVQDDYARGLGPDEDIDDDGEDDDDES